MGNAALLLKSQGHEIHGCDGNVYPPMSDVLAAAGISILDGFDAARLQSIAPSIDLVVVGNSISRGNPELEWLFNERKVKFTSLPALLHDEILCSRRNIVVAGTHGKTTTATLAAVLLRENGVDPGYFIGGVPRDLPAGASIGSADAPFVIEGDEYDSALFDKRSKFIHYAPHIAVINNIEFDHADIFRDIEDVKRAFNHFLRIVPGNGYILLNGDDPSAREVGNVAWSAVLRVGATDASDLRIRDFAEGPQGSSFSLWWKGRKWADVEWQVWGFCNVRNAAMAALASGLSLYPDDPTRLCMDALAAYKGVRRRQEILVETPKVIVIEDFGHHPTAVANILESMRARFPGRRLIAAFEPRSNTSRRRIQQQELIEALALADYALIGPIDRPEKVPAPERLDLDEVTNQLRARNVRADHFPSNERMLKALESEALSSGQPRSIIVFFTNGSFGGIIRRFVAGVRQTDSLPARPDLLNDDDVVSFPACRCACREV